MVSKKYFLLMLVLFVLISSSLAFAATEMTDCNTDISETGDYYLSTDLSCVGDIIILEGDDSMLDCQGHEITYDSDLDSSGTSIYGITINADNIILTNCNISGFNRAISVTSSQSGVNITNNTIRNSVEEGIRTWNNPNLIVENNQVYGNGDVGIRLAKAESSIISGNIVYNNKKGITFYTSSDNSYAFENFVSDNDDGILIGSGSTTSINLVIEKNVFCSNTNNDIYCYSGSTASGDSNYLTNKFACDDSNIWPTSSSYTLCSDMVDGDSDGIPDELDDESDDTSCSDGLDNDGDGDTDSDDSDCVCINDISFCFDEDSCSDFGGVWLSSVSQCMESGIDSDGDGCLNEDEVSYGLDSNDGSDCPIKGDLNIDYVVDSTDLEEFKTEFAESFRNSDYSGSADLNDDGKFTFADVLLFVKYYLS